MMSWNTATCCVFIAPPVASHESLRVGASIPVAVARFVSESPVEGERRGVVLGDLQKHGRSALFRSEGVQRFHETRGVPAPPARRTDGDLEHGEQTIPDVTESGPRRLPIVVDRDEGHGRGHDGDRGEPLADERPVDTEGIEFEEGDMSPSDSKMLREGIRRWQTVREEVAAVEDAAAGYGETVRLYHALRKAWIFHVRRRWWRRPPSVAFPPKIVVCQNRTLIGITSAKTWVRDVDSDRTGRVTLSARTPPFF